MRSISTHPKTTSEPHVSPGGSHYEAQADEERRLMKPSQNSRLRFSREIGLPSLYKILYE